MSGETNRNAQSLSRHNPSRINKLQHVVSTEWMGVGDQSPMNYLRSNFSDRLLTGCRRGTLLSQILINSLGIIST